MILFVYCLANYDREAMNRTLEVSKDVVDTRK